MTEDRFIAKHAGVWKEFESLLTELQKKGYRKADFITLQKLDHTYKQISGHLSYAQTYFPDSEVSHYLNNLVSSAHNRIYAAKRGSLSSLIHLYTSDIPNIIRRNILFLLVSLSIFLGAALFSFSYTWFKPETAFAFLPPEYIQNLNLKGTASPEWNHPIMSGLIMSNNIYVSLQAFAYGISFGIGTAYVLLQNGLLLGSLSALAMKQGQSLIYWSYILPHGIVELTAIFISGTAGLMVGFSLIHPGPYRRGDALMMRGETALKLIGLVVPMLVVAGFIEGFITPSSISPVNKLIFAGITALLIVFYLLIPRLSSVFSWRYIGK